MSQLPWEGVCATRCDSHCDKLREGKEQKTGGMHQTSSRISQHHYLIQQLGVASVGIWEWQLEWKRLFREAEIDIVAKFMEDIEGMIVQPNQHDRWGWRVDPSKVYTMGSIYKVLTRQLSRENNDEVFKELWKLKIPSKVLHFVWRLIRESLPTKVNFRRRNVDLNDVSCPFCRPKEEDASHLFFNCDKILPLWWESLSWLNIVDVSPE